MELWEFCGKNVKITLLNGQVFTGKAYDFVPEQDNDSGFASISVGDFELYQNEIAEIIIID